jgi:hypothetical protein
MASYAKFLGRSVTVNYRVGDIMLPATGIFVGDSGRSIFLEQHVEQRGRLNYFRWEIPYQYIQRIAESDGAVKELDLLANPLAAEDTKPAKEDLASRPSAFAAKAPSGASGLVPLSHRSKTA